MGYLELVKQARDQGKAIGAFNIFNMLSASGVVDAASERGEGVILQTSVKTVTYYGAERLYRMLRAATEAAPVPVLLNLDHCKDISIAKACVDAGWDCVMYDGSALPLAENIANTREVVEYAHTKGVVVEGEVGKIGGTEEDISVDEQEARQASLGDSLRFVEESGVDLFAPAIGTAHGVYRGKPHIDFALVEQLNRQISQPIVIHGGTGLEGETFHKLIRAGGSKVNVSTALKHAYFDGICAYCRQSAPSKEPLDIEKFLSKNIRDTAGYHIDIFRGERA